MSLDQGLKRGFQYFADYMRCVDQAAKTGIHHPDQIAHLLAATSKPATDWLKEATGIGGIDKTFNVTNVLLISVVTGDPFAGSRKDVQDLKRELGIK